MLAADIAQSRTVCAACITASAAHAANYQLPTSVQTAKRHRRVLDQLLSLQHIKTELGQFWSLSGIVRSLSEYSSMNLPLVFIFRNKSILNTTFESLTQAGSWLWRYFQGVRLLVWITGDDCRVLFIWTFFGLVLLVQPPPFQPDKMPQ